MSKKILVVDDEQTLARALIDKLSKENYQIIHANNGKQGLDIALKEHPDLILLDIIMPKMDGIKVLEKLRQDDWGKNTPGVIILTNLSEICEMEKVKRYQVDDCLVKTDWKIENIMEKIKTKLGK